MLKARLILLLFVVLFGPCKGRSDNIEKENP